MNGSWKMAKTLAQLVNITELQAREVIRCVFSTKVGEGIIATELASGRDFTITGFGSFRTRHLKASKGRNPQTGQPMMIAARTSVLFRAGKGLKERVRE